MNASETCIAVDSDLRPVRTHAISKTEAEALIASGEAHCFVSTASYVLTWASRFDTDARWYIFPREHTF